MSCFFCNDTATTDIYTLSLHDALPISNVVTDAASGVVDIFHGIDKAVAILGTISGKTVKLMVLALICLGNNRRSEERFSRNAETELVCRLLLEKKKPALSRRQMWLPRG